MDPEDFDAQADYDEPDFGQSSKGSLFILGGAGAIIAILLAFIGFKALTGGLGSGYEYDPDVAGPAFSQFEASGELAPRIPPPTVQMQVTSTPPGANLIVNGVAVGLQTPATVTVVENALNTVGFYLSGYESLVQNTDVTGSAPPMEATLVQIVEPEGWTPPPPPVAPEGGWPEGEPIPEPITEWSLPMGRIRIETRTPAGAVEGAEVLLNGVRQEGTTPLEIDVPARQEQHITVRLAGYRDSVGYVRTIPFEDFADMRFVPVELTADRGEDANRYTTFRVDTVPQQATLFLDGEDQGTRSLLNMQNPGHYVIRVEAEDHEPWERAYDAGPGIFETNVILTRPRSGPAMLTIVIEGETPYVPGEEEEDRDTTRTNIYLQPDYVGSPGFTRVGQSGLVDHELEAGDYIMRLANRTEDARLRIDLEATYEPGIHYFRTYRIEGEEVVVVEEHQEEIEE